MRSFLIIKFMNNLQPHLKVKKGDIASFVLLPGDPGRIEKIIKYWDKAGKIAYNREFLTYTGKYKGISVSVTSTGIGAPSAAIAVEELANAGARVFIRVGTCGALKEEIRPGDLIIPSQAIGQDGTTRDYIGEQCRVKPDKDVLDALKTSAQDLKFRYFVGVNRTHDTFYESAENFLNLMQLPEYKKGELVSSEMECSAIFAIAGLSGLRAGAVLAVNTSEPLEKISKNPELIYQLEVSPKAAKGVDDAIQVSLRAVELLNKK